jgi:hypothetical protein
MANARYRAVTDLSYPSPGSLKAVLTAGGLSKMSTTARAKVIITRVRAGGFADNIPEKSIKWLLKGGMIKVAGEPSAKAKGKVKR